MWSLYEEDGKKELKPKVFSNGKSQADIVDEVVSVVGEGRRVIFIHGVCGSGKSAIALNIAKELGRASVVVPIKNLQRQYEIDYMQNKQVFKDNGDKLKIQMITGRNNHVCPYLQENSSDIQETRKIEVDANIHDIFKRIKSGSFEGKGENKREIDHDKSADNRLIPCKIEIKEKNIQTLKKYYRENPHRKDNAGLNVKFLKRMAVGPACPYWSPIFPADLKINLEAPKKTYASIKGESSIYMRKTGCPYYSQFHSYADSDVVIFNSMQYLLETELGRKPATDVEIIDECDEFLDKLAAEGTINFNRARAESGFLYSQKPENMRLVDELNRILKKVYLEAKEKAGEEVYKLSETGIYELTELFAKNDYLEIIQDEDSYLEKTMDLCRRFYELAKEAYVSFYKVPNREEYGVRLVTINLDRVFGSLLDKNKVFVLMSGTLHSERVLKEIFGIQDFKVIEAEGVAQGAINKKKTGLEADFKYENFKNGTVTRKDYLRALDLAVGMAKRPTVVHVNAFRDLPSEDEIDGFELKNLIASEDLIEQQREDKNGRIVQGFKKGKTDILFTTRCNRGVDFPFETCNSTVITKFPYPHAKSLFWQILKKQKPAFFWDFYKDKAYRELLQKIYRSVRAKEDYVELLSPDIRVLDYNLF
jgi:Rad3-related DNA helicase